MATASFELGEEPKKENKTATQKQTLNSRKDMVQWQIMGYSKKREHRVASCCNDSGELGAWVEGMHMSIPKNLLCLRTNQPLFSQQFHFCWKPDTPNSHQTGLGIPFFLATLTFPFSFTPDMPFHIF